MLQVGMGGGGGGGWRGGGCGISVSACLCNRRRRLSGPLSADQHRCRWEVKSSPVTRHRRQRTVAQEAGQPSTPPSLPSLSLSFPLPPSSLKPSVALLRTPLPRTRSVRRPSLLHDCSGKDGVGSDKVPGLIDGQNRGLDERMDEGRGGSLTQANTERQRGTTYSAMQPLTAPQQFSPPITHCQWTPALLPVCSQRGGTIVTAC